MTEVDRGLAILSQPRPTQDLFYAAGDQQGTPIAARDSPGYREDHGLRGRNVYPHQPRAFEDGSWLIGGTGHEHGG